MGHLTRIANNVVQNMEKGPMQTQICEFIKGLPEDCRGRWESFVEQTLTEANQRNTVDLVTTHHLHSSSEDEDLEAAFPNDLSLQQAFSEYQIQQMTANFVDQFGFNDEEFADHEDNITAPFDRIAEINFSIDADDDCPNASLFEACCSERIQPFDDNEEEEEDEDIWEEKEVSYASQAKSRTRFGVSPTLEARSSVENGDPASSADSAKEDVGQAAGPPPSLPAEDRGGLLETDGTGSASEGSGWTAVFEAVNSTPPTSCVAMDVGSSVWESATDNLKTPEERGWAKFTDFQPFCCSESGPRCSSPVEVEGSDMPGEAHSSQEKSASTTSPCVWNVCVARKAPLVASDSSSSGGSDSEEGEDRAEAAPETTHTGSSLETDCLAVGVTKEKAPFPSKDSMAGDDQMTSTLESRLVKALDSRTAQSRGNLPEAPPAPEGSKRDRKELLPGAEALLNGLA